MICHQCNTNNRGDNNFCIECGYSLKGLTGMFGGVKRRIQNKEWGKDRAREWVSNIRVSIDNQIAGYIRQIDNQKELSLGDRKSVV